MSLCLRHTRIPNNNYSRRFLKPFSQMHIDKYNLLHIAWVCYQHLLAWFPKQKKNIPNNEILVSVQF
jgi:hypothetical protein